MSQTNSSTIQPTIQPTIRPSDQPSTHPRLESIIAATPELAALPTTTVRLLEILEDPIADARHVLEIVDKDPSLTANLLKLCNSAYYGLRRQVGTVRDALVMLGNQTVVTLAFATSMGDVLRSPLTAYRLPQSQLWYHALATALGSAYLVSLTADRSGRERAFTAGLVHDMGKLLLDPQFNERFQQLAPGLTTDELCAAERAALGFDHAEAGAALAKSWHFPDYLSVVIGHHHDPSAPPSDEPVVRAVTAANLIAVQAGFDGGATLAPEPALAEIIDDLGWSEAEWCELVTRLPHDVENLLSLLGD